jgi:hypothetical protein
MHPVRALALRRAAFAASGLLATLMAHAASDGDLHLLPIAPFAWLGMICVAALMMRPSATYAPRSAARTLALLVGVQCLMHLALVGAPWAFGLAGHTHGPAVTSTAVLTHALAAVALCVLLLRADRLLDAAVAAARLLRRALTPRPAGSPSIGPVLGERILSHARRAAGAPLARGPPVLVPSP